MQENFVFLFKLKSSLNVCLGFMKGLQLLYFKFIDLFCIFYFSGQEIL